MPTDQNDPRAPIDGTSRRSSRKEFLPPSMSLGAIAAYAALVLVVVFALVWQGQGEFVARPNGTGSGSPIAAPPSAEPARSANPANERAARELRNRAFIAYEDDRYAETLEYLDKARAVDPEGEKTEQVQTARRYCETQLGKVSDASTRGQNK